MADLPLDWESGAAARAVHLGIALDNLLGARDLVRGAMGNEWWAEEEQQHDRGNFTQEHPLYRQLTSPNDLALTEVAELAHYLRALKDDPAMPALIKDLRGPKFWPAFFELSMAYRWQDAGAAVHLAPTTAKGKADFGAMVEDRTFIVEVSRFEDDFVGSFRFGIPMALADAALKGLADIPPFVVKLVVHDELSASSENALRAALKETCHAFRQAMKQGETMLSKPFAAVTVTLELLTSASEDRPFALDADGQIVSVREHSWNAFFRLPDGTGGERARFFLQVPPEKRDFKSEVVKKTKRELDQLSGTTTPSVVMIDVSAFGDFYSLPFPSIGPQLLDLLRQHQRCTGLWFFSRQWTTAYRYKYWWTHLENPKSDVDVPEGFFERLVDREWRWDFLGNREYESTTEAEDRRRYGDRQPPGLR